MQESPLPTISETAPLQWNQWDNEATAIAGATPGQLFASAAESLQTTARRVGQDLKAVARGEINPLHLLNLTEYKLLLNIIKVGVFLAAADIAIGSISNAEAAQGNECRTIVYDGRTTFYSLLRNTFGFQGVNAEEYLIQEAARNPGVISYNPATDIASITSGATLNLCPPNTPLHINSEIIATQTPISAETIAATVQTVTGTLPSATPTAASAVTPVWPTPVTGTLPASEGYPWAVPMAATVFVGSIALSAAAHFGLVSKLKGYIGIGKKHINRQLAQTRVNNGELYLLLPGQKSGEGQFFNVGQTVSWLDASGNEIYSNLVALADGYYWLNYYAGSSHSHSRFPAFTATPPSLNRPPEIPQVNKITYNRGTGELGIPGFEMFYDGGEYTFKGITYTVFVDSTTYDETTLILQDPDGNNYQYAIALDPNENCYYLEPIN